MSHCALTVLLVLLSALTGRAEVYLSTDVGETWSARGPKGFEVTQIVPDPKTPTVAWAIAMPTVAAPGEDLKFVSPAVLRTRDSGKTWERIAAYPGPDPFCVAIDSENSDIVYVGGTFGRIQKSTDGGKTWALISLKDSCKKLDGTPAEFQQNVNFVCARGASLLIACIYPAAGHFLALSTDAGESWTLIGDKEVLVDCALAGDRILTVDIWGRAVSSVDGGKTWTTVREMRGMDARLGSGPGDFMTSPDGKEVVFSCRGETMSSVEGGDWKSWPASAKDAYACKIAWCGTRRLAIFQHGEYDEERPGHIFHAGDSRSFRVSEASGDWAPLPAPDARSPLTLANTCDGSGVWVLTK